MQCVNSMRRSKSRNQRKRERRQTAILAVALIIMWAVVAGMMLKTWANEPSISEAEHQQYIEMLKDGGGK